ncbi:MAG: response regulator transcription factor [Anaerolineae bacterium]|nr:response regulator transcription factor [Anaerolineae bacterium]
MILNLLVVEDEPEFADYLRRGLSYDGYQVRVASSAEAGLEEVRRSPPDLIIFDVMLPLMDGIMACRCLREWGYAGPVLMLTARDAIDDRVTGLDSGADDYLAKPFDFDELLARLRALLRRRGYGTSILSFADVELDTRLRTAARRGSTITLSRTEYDLLLFFLSYPEQTLTREVLLENIWGTAPGLNSNVLDIYISRLRHKLGEPPLIHTLYGIGYVLKK